MAKEFERPRIMICEDEPMIAINLAAEIAALGCDPVGPFASSREGLMALRDERIDAAILDVELSDGASTPLARALREADVRMIVLSGLQTTSPPPEFAGVEWLVKPADERRLRAFCHEAIASSRLRRAAVNLTPAGTSPNSGDLSP